ncbi:MAG: hypothetical protein HMLKMBBP_03572 [Planctomycetes bacterium]|nr:hypothetical protein [Planctomycetota bacterium]
MRTKTIRRTGAAALLAGAVLLADHGREATAYDYGFTLGAPVQVWPAGPAGSTRYMIPLDFDGDDRLDVVNVTATTAQVLRNTGTVANVPTFSLVQELPLTFSSCGNALDWDGDHDLDLILGDADRVLLASNDGTGFFTLSTLLTHNSGTAVSAFGFIDGDGIPPAPFVPDVTHRYIVWAQDTANGTGQIVLADGAPLPLFALPPGHADWIDVEHRPGEIARVLIANRQSNSVNPVDAYDVLPFGSPIVLPVAPPIGNPSSFGFGYNVDAAGGRVGWGSWAAGVIVGNPGEDPIAPIGPAFPNGEVSGFNFADMDGDMDTDEVVMVGRDTGVVVANFSTDADDPLHRFVSADIPGFTYHLETGDFNGGMSATTDVLVGGTEGLWFLSNDTGPDGPPPHDAHMKLMCAIDGLLDLLEETRIPDVDEGFGRQELANALAVLYGTDPDFLRDGLLDGPIPVGQAIDISIRILDATARIILASLDLEIALEPDNLDDTVAVLACLGDAHLDILEQIAELSMPPIPPAKPTGGTRRAARLRERFLDSFEIARQRDAEADFATGSDALLAREEAADALSRASRRGIQALRASRKIRR